MEFESYRAAMDPKSSERSVWQAVIDAHPLESHDPAEWLNYGVALLQTITPGAEAAKQQQQAALAFVQAQKEGAMAEEVAAAQRRSALLSLREALTLADFAVPDHLGEGDSRPAEAAASDRTAAKDPLRVLLAGLAHAFELELLEPATVLDQLLAVKEQLRSQQIESATVEAVLLKMLPTQEPAWMESLQKVLLVLR